MMQKQKANCYIVLWSCSIAFHLFFAVSSNAQVRMEPVPPRKISVEEEKAREQTRWMNKNLLLDVDQYEQVSYINLSFVHKFDSVEKIKDARQRVDGQKALKQKKETLFKTILTEKQFKDFLEHKEKHVDTRNSPFTGN